MKLGRKKTRRKSNPNPRIVRPVVPRTFDRPHRRRDLPERPRPPPSGYRELRRPCFARRPRVYRILLDQKRLEFPVTQPPSFHPFAHVNNFPKPVKVYRTTRTRTRTPAGLGRSEPPGLAPLPLLRGMGLRLAATPHSCRSSGKDALALLAAELCVPSSTILRNNVGQWNRCSCKMSRRAASRLAGGSGFLPKRTGPAQV